MSVGRVVVVAPGLYPCVTGGAEVFNYNIIKALKDRFSVDYLSACRQEIDGARLIKIPFRRVVFEQIYIFLRLMFISRKALVIVSFMDTKWRYIIGYPILNAFLGKRYILICHSGGVPEWEWNYPYKLLFSRSEAAFGVSSGICSEYKKRTGVEVEFLPPIIPFERSQVDKDEIRKRYAIDADEKVYLAVGSLKEIKRPMVVLSALLGVGRQYLEENRIRLVFAGDGKLRDEMRAYIAEHNLDGVVLLLGNVPRERLHDIYKMSDVYIMASDFEGTPIAMLEAIYNGLLVLGSDAVGIREIVNNARCGFLFDNSRPQELSALIKLSNENLFADRRFSGEIYYKSNYCYQKFISEFTHRLGEQ